jgi:hypothetical protein
MIDIKVRYNTNCVDNHMFWRILIDGIEYLVSNIIFEIPTHTTRDVVYDPSRESDVDRHHLSCTTNEVIWKGDIVIIK